jgi:hypothetical protein
MPLGRAALDFHVQQRDRQYKVVVLGSLTQPPLGSHWYSRLRTDANTRI